MKSTMTKAHNIRKAAAKKWNCEVSDICFSCCLKMAWAGEELMTTLTKENMISAGGNIWEKGNMSRVYLNDSAIEKAFELKLDDKASYLGQFKSIGKAKVWFDCKTETLHSDKGMVRVMFNQNKIECAK